MMTNKELTKADALKMASKIVSNNAKICIVYSRQENQRTVALEKDYVFDSCGYYKRNSCSYYKTSSDVASYTDDYLTLDEMITELLDFCKGDLEEGESLNVFIETI